MKLNSFDPGVTHGPCVLPFFCAAISRHTGRLEVFLKESFPAFQCNLEHFELLNLICLEERTNAKERCKMAWEHLYTFMDLWMRDLEMV